MNLVEKVARAIQSSIQRREFGGIAYTDDDKLWAQAWANPSIREDFSRQARAALGAMRQPTQEMRLAAWDLLEGNRKCGNLDLPQRGNGMPDAILQAMIDASLKEGE